MSRPEEPGSSGGPGEQPVADDRWRVAESGGEPTGPAWGDPPSPPAPRQAPQWTDGTGVAPTDPLSSPAFDAPPSPAAPPAPVGSPPPGMTPEQSTVRLPPQPAAPPASAPPAYPTVPAAYPAPPYPGAPAYPGSAPPAYPNYEAAPGYPAQQVYSAPPAYPTQTMYSAAPVYSAPPGAYGGYPPPTPPRRRTGLILGIVGLAVVAVLAGLGAFALVNRQEKNATPTAGSTTAPPTAGATTPAPTPTDFSGDLRTLLLSRPADASPYDKPLSKDGTLNADEIAQLYPNPDDVKQILANDGFQSAAVAQWVASDNSSVEIKLYAFGDDDGAASWSNAEAHAYTDDATLHDESPISGIDASTLVVDPTPDSDGFILTVAIAVRHNVAMKIFVYQPSKATESVTIKLAQQQFSRIP